jgi:hypothetical protein
VNHVRKITVEDPNPPGPGTFPVHIGRLVLFDGEEPRGCMVASSVRVESEANDGTRVTLHVLPDDVRTEPIPSPAEAIDYECFRVFIGEHEFLTPRGAVDPEALRAADPTEFIPVEVYVAEVHFQ